MSDVEEGARDHLFISYASEDEELAKWLALRLTAEGYKVWIACFELLGGESFPEDIDRAIQERTFRVLGLLSEDSLHKNDPLGERTLAVNIAQERDEPFLIPINVDGLKPSKLSFRTSHISFIPFSNSWADGLEQLLKRLQKHGAPKAADNGKEVAASVYLPDDIISEDPETLYANLLEFERIPDVVHSFTSLRRLSRGQRDSLADAWAFWALPGKTGGGTYFSFDRPPDEAPGAGRLQWTPGQAGRWRDMQSIHGRHPEHVLKPLLRRTILHHLRKKGLRPVSLDDSQVLYFPPDLVPGDNLSFSTPRGKTTYRKVVGDRKYPNGERFRYHQAVTVDVLRDLVPDFVLKFRTRLHITDLDGVPLEGQSANARRRYLTQDWWNDEWLARLRSILTFMSDGDGPINIGDEDPLVLSDSLVTTTVPQGINEDAVPKRSGTPQRYQTGSKDEEDVESG